MSVRSGKPDLSDAATAPESVAERVMGWLKRPPELTDGPQPPLVQAKQLVALAPTDAASHAALGWSYLQVGRASLAEAAYLQAINLDPTHVPALLGVAAACICAGKSEEAAHWMSTARRPGDLEDAPPVESTTSKSGVESQSSIACDGESEAGPDATLERAVALAADGRHADAHDAYAAILAADPDHVRAWCGFGVTLGRMGRQDEAMAAFRAAVERDPKYARALTNLGVSHRRRGENDDAVSCYERALAADPACLEARYDLAVTYYELGKHDQAASLYREVLDHDPTHIRACCGLGTALYEEGKLREAVRWYRKAIGLDPEDPVAHYFLGLAEVADRNEPGALREYRILQDLDESLAMRLFAALYPEE
ncbi:MAG: hypothetical protein CMJ83_15810 [Planctomycetes bacterium]|nr:hypothetical protein [Planctomycetota bacterium]